MTFGFCRLAAVARGPAHRPEVMEEHSSSQHHLHRNWRPITVSAFFIYPVESRGKIAGKNRGEKSRGKIAGKNRGGKSRGKIAGKNRGEKSRGKIAGKI
jgi:hypothetical protein